MGTRTARRLALTPGWVSGRLSLVARQRPILDWRFAEDRSLVDRIRGLPLTFTRVSGSTFTDLLGVVNSAGNDVAVFGPQGIELWEARTNLLGNSQDYTNLGWARSNVTVTISGTAPDGTNTANVVTGNGSSPNFIQTGPSVTSGTWYTLSGHFKAGTLSTVQMLALGTVWNSGGANPNITLNLNTGVGTPANMPANSHWYVEPLANGWYRLAMILAATATGASNQQFVRLTSTTGSVLAWGMQLEAGVGASPYIATTTTSVTRGADAPVTTDLSWLSTSGGVFYAEGITYPVNSASINSCFSLDDTTPNNRFQLRATNRQASGISINGGVIGFNQPIAGAWQPGVQTRATMRHRAADVQVACGGAATITGSVTLPTPTRLIVGQGASLSGFNGRLARLAYFGPGAALSRLLELSV